MAKKRKSAKKAGKAEVKGYRHREAKRPNNPPAGIAPENPIPPHQKARYPYYSPRLDPALQFDPDATAEKRLEELLSKAVAEPLTTEEAEELAGFYHQQQPWLEWAEKRERDAQGFFEVDPVALNLHERLSGQAIVKLAARQDVQRTLFADPEHDYSKAIQFYQHDVDWANRLILGDNLQVMSSLIEREDLAGKVQMIYVDPPYGIRFGSNFQPQIGRRDVKDRDQDLTREMEMVKAYRDTWHLGVHSYLNYLRDRLVLSRELLTDSGSIFVQISDENLQLVRCLLDEVFGRENFCSLITFQKTAAVSSPEARTNVIGTLGDYLLWYARNLPKVKYRQPYLRKV